MKVSLLVLLLACPAVPLRPAPLPRQATLPGPLVHIPSGWLHQADLCLHASCGTYTHTLTGTVVTYYSRDPDMLLPTESDTPPDAERFQGSLGGHPYWGFQVPDARAWDMFELKRSAPDLLPHIDDPSRVTLSPRGSTGLAIWFETATREWRFTSSICHAVEAARVHELLLTTYRIAGEPESP